MYLGVTMHTPDKPIYTSADDNTERLDKFIDEQWEWLKRKDRQGQLDFIQFLLERDLIKLENVIEKYEEQIGEYWNTICRESR